MKENYEEEIKMNNIDKKDSSKNDDPEINMIVENENISRNNNILSLFLLNNSFHINNIINSSNFYQSISDSTNIESLLNINLNNSNITEFTNLHKFNSLRADYYLKYNLYDIPLIDDIFNFNNNLAFPPKYKIKEELFGFVYPNDLITYSISITGILSNNKILNYDLNKKLEVKDSQFYSILGLYFCGNI